MGYLDLFKTKKTLSELEEEREYNEAEISILQQRVLKKELEKRGVELSQFKDEHGNTMWKKVINFLKK